MKKKIVIGIIVLIFIIIIATSVIYIIKRQEKLKQEQEIQEEYEKLKNYICDVGATYQIEQDNDLFVSDKTQKVSLKELNDQKVLDDDIIDPNTKKDIDLNKILVVHYHSGQPYTCDIE